MHNISYIYIYIYEDIYLNTEDIFFSDHENDSKPVSVYYIGHRSDRECLLWWFTCNWGGL